jgi:ABC-type phosphate transport system substrate-binding protein
VRFSTTLKVGLAGILSVGASVLVAGVASADYAPSSSDVVGVGGDTPQYAASFLADGDYSGDAGFNASGAFNRLVTFNATADANGRTGYLNGSTLSSPSLLNPTVVLRAGEVPVQRVSSSGGAISALLADTAGNINFIFSSSEPTAANQTTAASRGWGFLHVVEIGTDQVQIATASTTNAPAGLSPAELLGIYTGAYTAWNQLPGNSGGSSDTIVPLIPPSSSAIYKALISVLTTANGGTAPTLSASVKTVEQNDPTAITSLGASAPDAIVPFSAARLSLWNANYFHNPSTAYPGGSALTAGIKLLSATAPDGVGAATYPITDYVIFRNSDATSTTIFEPGGTRNWVQTLFSNPGGNSPLVKSSAGQALIAASGVTPVYNDLGDVSSG